MTLAIKRTLVFAGLGLALLLTGDLIISAQDPFCTTGGGANTAYCQAQAENPLDGDQGIFSRILDFVYWLALVITVIGVVIGGIRFTLSGGDAGKTASARKMIIYSLVGLIVTVLAGAIVALVLSESS